MIECILNEDDSGITTVDMWILTPQCAGQGQRRQRINELVIQVRVVLCTRSAARAGDRLVRCHHKQPIREGLDTTSIRTDYCRCLAGQALLKGGRAHPHLNHSASN